MNMINDGGPAFPVWELNGKDQPEMTGFGMSLRDYFAAKVLPAVYRVFCDDIRASETAVPEGWREGIALDAYALADAMLKVRGRRAMTDRQTTHCGIMNWVRMSDRKPTADDADESGTVWVYDRVFAEVSSAHFYQTYLPYYTHWMPKEKRPAPPAPKGEQQ